MAGNCPDANYHELKDGKRDQTSVVINPNQEDECVYLIVIALDGNEKEISVNQRKAVKKLLDPLIGAGLTAKFFYSQSQSLEVDGTYSPWCCSKSYASGNPAFLLCELRPTLNALMHEASYINLPMLIDENKLKNLAESKQFLVGKTSDDKYEPYQYIYMKYDLKVAELHNIYAENPNKTGIFTMADQVMLIESIIINCKEYGKEKRKTSLKILDCFPLDNKSVLDHFQDDWKFEQWNLCGNLAVVFKAVWPWKQPLEKLKNYYGTQVAMYFAYLCYYTKCLLFSGLVGLAVYIIEMTCETTFQYDSLVWSSKRQIVQLYTIPFFGVFMAVWATLFVEGWKRQSSVHALQWGTTNYHEIEQERPQFEGIPGACPTTGATIKIADKIKMRWRRFASWCVLLVMIVLVLILTALIFYLRWYLAGYENNKKFHFDVKGFDIPVGSIIVSLVNLIVMYGMSRLYNNVSLQMNDYENHSTQSIYEAQYAIKSVIFNFVNSYAALIYIACFKSTVEGYCARDNCLNELQYSLLIIYGCQIVIGNIKEVFLPRLCTSFTKNKYDMGDVQSMHHFENQFFQSHYGWKGTFDDYLEMVLQVGYSTFFVAALPLTPLFSFINNLLEIFIDRFRVQNDCRRPRAQMVSSIGLWQTVLEIFVTIAIISNSWVIFYTYGYVSVLSQYVKTIGNEWISEIVHLELALFLSFVVVLMAFRAAIAKFINDVPWYVRRQLARQQFLTSKVIDSVRNDDDKRLRVADELPEDFPIYPHQ